MGDAWLAVEARYSSRKPELPALLVLPQRSTTTRPAVNWARELAANRGRSKNGRRFFIQERGVQTFDNGPAATMRPRQDSVKRFLPSLSVNVAEVPFFGAH